MALTLPAHELLACAHLIGAAGAMTLKEFERAVRERVKDLSPRSALIELVKCGAVGVTCRDQGQGSDDFEFCDQS